MRGVCNDKNSVKSMKNYTEDDINHIGTGKRYVTHHKVNELSVRWPVRLAGYLVDRVLQLPLEGS